MSPLSALPAGTLHGCGVTAAVPVYCVMGGVAVVVALVVALVVAFPEFECACALPRRDICCRALRAQRGRTVGPIRPRTLCRRHCPRRLAGAARAAARP